MYKAYKQKERFDFKSEKFRVNHTIHTIPIEYLKHQTENDGPVLTFEM